MTFLHVLLWSYVILNSACLTPAKMAPGKLEIRLVDGPDSSQGRVEIRAADESNVKKNPWGTICNDQYELNNKGATVICRQLGYIWGESAANGVFGAGERSVPIYLDDVMCIGNESGITECTHSGWGVHNCYHHEDVGAICHNHTVRLQTPLSRQDVGAVQVMYNYKWGDVCDTGWDNVAATLVCQELGFVSGIAECCSALGPSDLSDVDKSFIYTCKGNESSIQECHNTSDSRLCDYSHRASVVCHNVTKDNINTSFAVRLQDGDTNWGHVQVRHAGMWGQVCNNKWNDAAANVTCRQLNQGFVGGVAYGPVFLNFTQPSWLVDVRCRGNETSLEQCLYTQWGEPMVYRCAPAYVLCYKTTGLQIAIVGGKLPSVGRVQITYDGVNGSICTNEWTNNDANLVCRMKGFADGAIKTPFNDTSVGPYFMNRLICNNPETIYMCGNRGWLRDVKDCKQSAHVICFNKVRLAGGNEYSGVLEIYQQDSWVGLCDQGFKPEYAKLACKEIGYQSGTILPQGAYGKYYKHLSRPYIQCNASETSLLNCDYDKQVSCTSTLYHYVAVCCHEDGPEPEIKYKLFDNMDAQNASASYGRVGVYMHHVWGEICGDGWSDTEASVFCKTMGKGYSGGVASFYAKMKYMPTLLSHVVCNGSETVFNQCVIGDYFVCQSTLRAGAVCFTDTAPKLRLADGGQNFGRLEFMHDGTLGSVCDFSWTDVKASVACRELNMNFTQGEKYSNFPKGKGDVVLSNIVCSGLERSLLKCSNNGWRAPVKPKCSDHSHDVGVYCYGHVRVVNGWKNPDSIAGRVQILDPSTDSTWITVCADDFDQVDADTICKEMGLPIARVMAPGTFGVKHNWRFYTNMTCREGGSNVKTDCNVTQGECGYPSTHNYASIMCHKANLNPETKVHITNGYHGMVIVEQFGINGTICFDGWDDKDASVVCRQKGYAGGVVLGHSNEIYSRSQPIWFTNVSCSGEEARFEECSKDDRVSMNCSVSLKAAGVLCYKTSGVEVTLVGGYSSVKDRPDSGTVQITYDGKTGSICDSDWSKYDARVLCRQLGFPDGDPNWKSFFTPISNGTVYMSGLTCDSKEESILACPNMGWSVSQTSCADHSRDAGVFCHSFVLLRENNNYGIAYVYNQGQYEMLCEDQFTDKDATVLCRTYGLQYGKSLCCNAFGPPRKASDIRDTVSVCSGREMHYDDCPIREGSSCRTENYASIVCSSESPSDWFEVKISEVSKGSGTGHVIINYMGLDGFMCDVNFDDADANVICKQLGYNGGYAYRLFNDSSVLRSGRTRNLRWLRGPDCTGNENQLQTCEGIQFGNLSGCSVMVHAAVSCYMQEDKGQFEVRLSNSPHPGEGYVQVRHKSVWGSVCRSRSSKYSSFDEAEVICRQLNFKYGMELNSPSYPILKGDVTLTNLNCNGNESHVRYCMMSGLGDATVPNSRCGRHKSDLAVKCYTNVQLSGSAYANYGMVLVLNETDNSWGGVCDTDFDDNDAKVVCKSLGFKNGKAECCAALGPKLVYRKIIVSNAGCMGNESVFSECSYEMRPNITCQSGQYASAICTDEIIMKEDLKVNITGGKHFGLVTVTRYGVKGSVCDVGWDDRDARVLCRQLGFINGFSTNGTSTDPVLLTSVNCSGSEDNLQDCRYPSINEGHQCNNRRSRAAVVCSMDNGFLQPIYYTGTHQLLENSRLAILRQSKGTSLSIYKHSTDVPFDQTFHSYSDQFFYFTMFYTITEPIRYRIADEDDGEGIAEIYINGQWGTICEMYWENKDANMFCKQLGYQYGETSVQISLGRSNMPIWLSHVECNEDETDFMQCRASWDIDKISQCTHFDDAGVKCYRSVRLNRGDYRTRKTNGILEVYIPQKDPHANVWYTICADTFTEKEANVACRALGHQHGMPVCCSPYGYNTGSMTTYRPKCKGSESQMSECEMVYNETRCSRNNYASLVCFNDTTSKTDYSLRLKGSLGYTGQVVVNYMGISGRICWTGWTDEDAQVVCRELGFNNGSAYYHYKTVVYLNYDGPYWTSDVKCTGNETKLGDCPHKGFGKVTDCKDEGHYAGVICFDDKDVAYRITGGDAHYGRVEFSYKNEWYSVCSRRNTWGTSEAHVLCRQLGYATGDSYNGKYLNQAAGRPYSIDFRCTGDEKNLNDCPHGGIQESYYCDDHNDDVGVVCYTGVKLIGESNNNIGALQYYHDDGWKLICDEGFDDVTAKKACQEMGYFDGKAICCSAFRPMTWSYILANKSLHCEGSEKNIYDCLQNSSCPSDQYTSVACFKLDQPIEEESYSFRLSEGTRGVVEVQHFSETGYICSRDWDDTDAAVYCRTLGFKDGIAYQYSALSSEGLNGPYWLSEFNCTGSEKKLLDCPHNDRQNLGNCSKDNFAAALCFNESGISYRMIGGENYGRVEVSVGGKWGTVCDKYWDNREASVFCRQMNFTDGEAVGRAHFGEGDGTIWLSHLECEGTENNIHQCPHKGFDSPVSTSFINWFFSVKCQTHRDDAGVFCYKSVRLNNGPNSNAGGLEIHKDGKWYGVCDSSFDNNAALVACKSIKPTTFVDARPIPGSVYGDLSGAILFSNVVCNGTETDFEQCKKEFNTTCPSGHYVSVHCSNETIVDDGFKMRLAYDSLASQMHGILEVRVNGVWGRVCLHKFDDAAASVACKQLGHDGGVAYLHIMKNDKPILMTDLKCAGNESSIDQCSNNQMTPNLKYCHYGANDAGIICYKKSDNLAFQFRLNGNSDPSEGRVEIGYQDRWGLVCSWSWQTADAKVLCRSLGYRDGIVVYDVNKALKYKRPWVTGFFCQGNETTPMTCLNTGFNSTFLIDLCEGRSEPGAYTKCFNEEIRQSGLRLVGPNDHSGRLEVYVSGANQWGTVCDDFWRSQTGNMAPEVVCKQLGYYGGKAELSSVYGPGKGIIWYDNLRCFGNESALFECEHRGLGTHNCKHSEDVGVTCLLTPPSTVPAITTKTTTPSVPTVVTTTQKIPSTSTTEPTSKPTTPRSTTALTMVTTSTPKPPAATITTSPSTTQTTTMASTTASSTPSSTTASSTPSSTTASSTPSSTTASSTPSSTTASSTPSSTTASSTPSSTTTSSTPSSTTASSTPSSTTASSTPSSTTASSTPSSTTSRPTTTPVPTSTSTPEPTSTTRRLTTTASTTSSSTTTIQTSPPQTSKVTIIPTTKSVTKQTVVSSSSTSTSPTTPVKSSPKPTVPSSTTVSSTVNTPEQNSDNTEKLKSSPPQKANMGVLVSVPLAILVVIIAIILIVLLIRSRRRRRSGQYHQEILDDSGVNCSPDGSVGVSNRLYELSPESSDYNNQTPPDNMDVGRNGNAHHKKPVNGNNGTNSSAFSNPLYEANKDFESSDNQNMWRKGLPENDEITFPVDNLVHDSNSTA